MKLFVLKLDACKAPLFQKSEKTPSQTEDGPKVFGLIGEGILFVS